MQAVTLAHARTTFAGRDRYSAEYLNIRQGEALIVCEQTNNEGWLLAAKIEDNHWNTGWIPATFWSKDEVHMNSLADFFREETFGNMSDAIASYVGRLGALIPVARFTARYVNSGMHNRQQWLRIAALEGMYPTLRADVRRYGMPSLHPFPEWTAWQMRIIVYYERYTPAAIEFGEGWHWWETHWMQNLQEVARTFRQVFQTVGVYKHLEIGLSEWCWDYFENQWGLRNEI